MAILICDSFQHYTTLSDKWTVTGAPTIDATQGRGGGPALKISTNTGAVKRKFATSLKTTVFCGFRFKATTPPSSGSFCSLLKLYNNLTQVATLRLHNDGTIGVTDVLGTVSYSTKYIDSSTFNYLELKIAPTTFEVRINNEASWHTGSGKNFGSGVDTVEIVTGSAGPVIYFCDFVLSDTTGSINTDFIGPKNVDAYLPSGAGSNTNWTPSTGSNYACVDDNPPDTDDYVETDVEGTIDSYAFTDITGNNAAITAAIVNMYAIKAEENPVYIQAYCLSNGTSATQSSQTLSPSVWKMVHGVFEVDPNTSSAWSKTALNAAEFGVKLTYSL